MRKTQRRKLYGRSRRRQRGGVNCRLLVVGAALVALQGAHADEPTLATYVSNYIQKGDWLSSKDLGEKLASYIPTPEDAFGLAENTFGSWQSYFDKSSASSDSCATPPGPPITIGEAAKVVEPYLLSPGERVDIMVTNSGNYDGIPTIRRGTIVSIGKGEAEKIVGDDIETVTVDGYRIKEHDEDDDEIAVFFPSDYVKLTPVPKGGRKSRRKTLRRK
jgi:hypothetical protein